jgi:oligopeptide/dipeptide ABC transporter ATP-binding protein
MIGLALTLRPQLLIADEPTSALDATMESQIISLFARLRDECGTAIILVSHDLGVIATLSDRVMVLYAGEAVEEAGVYELFSTPTHPYTRALLAAIRAQGTTGRLAIIPGMLPDAAAMPLGCRFADRCEFRRPVCVERAPPVYTERDHMTRCVLVMPAAVTTEIKNE